MFEKSSVQSGVSEDATSGDHRSSLLSTSRSARLRDITIQFDSFFPSGQPGLVEFDLLEREEPLAGREAGDDRREAQVTVGDVHHEDAVRRQA